MGSEKRKDAPLRKLNDNSQLVNEEVVGRVNDDGNVVQVTSGDEVFVVVVALVLAERAREGWARGLGCTMERGGVRWGAQTGGRVRKDRVQRGEEGGREGDGSRAEG